MKKFKDKDELELLQEFEEDGYVYHICPNCGEECQEVEIDSPQAFCPDCDELVDVEPVI